MSTIALFQLLFVSPLSAGRRGARTALALSAASMFLVCLPTSCWCCLCACFWHLACFYLAGYFHLFIASVCLHYHSSPYSEGEVPQNSRTAPETQLLGVPSKEEGATARFMFEIIQCWTLTSKCCFNHINIMDNWILVKRRIDRVKATGVTPGQDSNLEAKRKPTHTLPPWSKFCPWTTPEPACKVSPTSAVTSVRGVHDNCSY